MSFLNLKKAGLFRFDEGDERFELTETEHGAPRGMTGFPEAERSGEGITRDSVPRSVGEAYEKLKLMFRADINKDVIMRWFLIGGRHEALLVYMNGMADDRKINDFILRPLMTASVRRITADTLLNEVIEIAEAVKKTELGEVALDVTDGVTALFIDGETECVCLETRGYEKRAVGETSNEKVVRGPKEGFTESARTNITLIRRIIHTDDLVAEFRSSGGSNLTRTALVYREGTADPRLVNEVKRRLARVAAPAVTSSGIPEQFIEDSGLSPLPQILATERPDRAASHIMQGRVCLIVEGSPSALIMPVTLFTLMNSPEDVYMRRPLGTVLRLVRYVGALVSVLLPGYFLALALYHQGVLSTEVLSTVIASRRMVFEPIGVEILLLLLIFQMIREAGLRVPGDIGQAIGIIGGLIMGQAAVAAHLASSVVLIIVAVSGLGNFCIPDYSTQITASYLRVAMVIAAWMGGLLGMVSTALLACCLLASMKSFGVPFLAPFAPKTYSKRPFVVRGRMGRHRRADDYANTADDRKVGENAK